MNPKSTSVRFDPMALRIQVLESEANWLKKVKTNRRNEILAAMKYNSMHGICIPTAWIEELSNLVDL